jgi:alpha-beta hydrolase superfamily lysophospholipase
LSACSVGGALPPSPEGKAVPTDVTVAATNGERLATVEWIPDEPRAVILGIHGYGGYGELTFRRAAAFWKTQGIATISYDQRGFGRNASFGYWPGPDGLIDDAVSISKQVRQRFPGIPMVVIGHSMGGGVITAAETRGMEADRLVLAGPAIWGGSLLNPIYRASAWIAAGLFPERRLSGKGVVRIQASDNIEALRELGRDARYLAPPSARELHGLVILTDVAEEAADKVKTPSLMLLGSKDQIVVNSAARKTFDRFAGEKHVVEYPDGWHLLFRDLQAEIVWQDVANWVLNGTAPARRNAIPRG